MSDINEHANSYKSKITQPKELTVAQIICGISFFMCSITCSMVIMNIPLAVPLYMSLLYFLGLSQYLGYNFQVMQDAISDSIRESAPALLILMSVGSLIGTWTMSGIVPTITYYGLKFIQPNILLPTAVLACSITSSILGSSWGTVGTLGIALMGISQGFGIPLPVTAGAILSGAYFGDKASPLSDSVILVTATSKVKVIKHVKNLIPVSIPALILTIIIFYFIGLQYAIEGTTSSLGRIIVYQQAIKEMFIITPLSFVPVIFIVIMLIMEIPAMITIAIGAFVGAFWGVWIQGLEWNVMLTSLYKGPQLSSSSQEINDLFSIGGIEYMAAPILIMIFGISIAGVLQGIGLLSKLCSGLERFVRGQFSLVLITIIIAILINIFGSSMYMSLILTPKIVKRFYDQLNLSPYLMSRSVEIGGTLTSCCIPWSDNGIFIRTTLQVANLDFIPYYILIHTCFVIALLYAYFGWFDASNTRDDKDSLK